MVIRRLMFPVFVLAASCSKSGPTPSAPPAPAPPPPATAGASQGRGGAPPGAPGAPGAPGGGRGTPLTPEQNAARRDSIGALRGATVAQVLATIAGKEDQPAGQVFKNVQVLKDVPAKRFLTMMDSTFGRALSLNCTSCHVATDWSDDTRPNKGRTRIMINMVNAINNEHLTKMPAGRGGATPTITCITCHRGNGNPGTRILP